MNNTKQSNESTNKEKKREKIALNIFKQSSKEFSLSLFLFAIFTLLSLIIAYLLPASLIVSVPFIIMPSYFAFTSRDAFKIARNDNEVGFFNAFRLYFSQLFSGGYRVLIGILKSIFAYLVSNIILLTVFEYTVFVKIDEFKSIMEAATSTNNLSGLLEQYTNLLLTNQTIKECFVLVSCISVFVSAIVFIHHVAKHSPKMRRNIMSKQPVPMRLFNLIDRRVRRKYFKRLFKFYLRGAWFIQLLVILSGVGGTLICFFFLKDQDTSSLSIIPLALMFVILLPFMNYISKMQDVVYSSLKYAYEDEYISMSLEFINKYKDKIDIETKDLEELESLLKKEQDQRNQETDKDNDKNKDE